MDERLLFFLPGRPKAISGHGKVISGNLGQEARITLTGLCEPGASKIGGD